MARRTLEAALQRLSGAYPIVTLTGLGNRARPRWLGRHSRSRSTSTWKSPSSASSLPAIRAASSASSPARRSSMKCNGQLLNLSSLGNDCGVTHATARRWISVLETSFLITLPGPHFRNFNKRLVKSPKLYFLDPGLLCYLLRIRSPEELRTHSARGSIFESFVLAELLKNYHHHREEPALCFWRDSHGPEIDILVDRGADAVAMTQAPGSLAGAVPGRDRPGKRGSTYGESGSSHPGTQGRLR